MIITVRVLGPAAANASRRRCLWGCPLPECWPARGGNGEYYEVCLSLLNGGSSPNRSSSLLATLRAAHAIRVANAAMPRRAKAKSISHPPSVTAAA